MSLLHSGMMIEVTGDGFPVLMVHGLGGTSNTFQPLMSSLTSYKVIRVDLAGSGRSPLPFETLSIDYFAQSLIALLNELNTEKVHVVAHSMGTLTAQTLATIAPLRVASLTLCGALTEPPDAARVGLLERAKIARTHGMAGIADAIVVNTLSPSTHSEKPEVIAFVRETLMRQNGEAYAQNCEALSNAKAIDGRLIKAPTLLIAGDCDPVAPLSMAKKLNETIKNSSHTILKNCGHWMTLEKSKETSRKLVDFINNHGR